MLLLFCGIAAGVPHPALAAAKVEAVVASVVFAEADGSYSIRVRGAELNAGTYRLIFEDLPILDFCTVAKPEDCKDQSRKAVLEAAGQEVVFSGIPAADAGAHKLRVQLDGAIISQQLAVSFSQYPEDVARWLSGIIVLLLVLVIWGLLASGSHRKTANGQQYGPVKSLLLDADTSTYSLTKLQAYIWIFIAIAGYVYLSLAKTLVQGHLEFAAVPQNLGALVAISLGTVAGSTATASLGGGKGSGDYQPRPSDLITSGGVVAPERLQFLLWTILGGLLFLVFTFSISPARIENLPAIPADFLQLTGISAAGYVGGKIARGPGPKITGMTGVIGASITLTIDGTYLAAKGAGYYLAAIPAGGGGADQPISPTIDLDSTVADPAGYATRIVMRVPDTGALTFTAGQKYRFTIVNPDGEKAVWEFAAQGPASAPGITGITAAIAAADTTMIIEGTGLSADARFFAAEAAAAHGQETAVAATVDRPNSLFDAQGNATRLRVRFPTTTGPLAFTAGRTYRITIANPDGGRASREVTP